jgi:hypothetical protein
VHCLGRRHHSNDVGVQLDFLSPTWSRARRRDRVVAVIGASHVVVQEPTLIMEFGSPQQK